ncbi:MAG: response regulator transcription factor [Bryobacterales bacterium]|nr:response regulator transcription factor [Bryobacterales bacterium]
MSIPAVYCGGKRKVLVVDDHPIVREGMALLINREADLTVCADAEESNAALDAIENFRPDLAIVDISLPGRDGLELLKMIRAKDPQMPVLILSMHGETIYAERALRAGANGYIMKQEATEKVLVAIRRILNREIYVSEQIANRMLRQMVGAPAPNRRSPFEGLSDRELEVFRRMGEGQSTRHIADELHLSVKTIETHQARLKEKLSLRSARELVQYAIESVLAEKAEHL